MATSTPTRTAAGTHHAAAPRRYSGVAIGLHWLIALLMFCGFYLGWIMTDIPGFTPTKLKYFSWHKWIGVTVFTLAAIRLLWRLTHRPPELPDTTSTFQKAAAHAVHGLLYLLMLAIPVSGYFFSSAAGIQVVYLGIVPLPTIIGPDKALKAVMLTTHIVLNYALLALVAAHVLAALKHHFLERDGILGRMIPFLK
jgi:cytochrome b561